MIQTQRVLWVGALVIAASACQTQTTTSYDGRAVYVAYCASCHGVAGAGDGPVARSLNVVPPDLRTISARNEGRFPRADVEAIIDGQTVRAVHGTTDMPVWGVELRRLGGYTSGADEAANEQIDTLVDYLASIQGGG